ncbi:hypothetical protein DFH06DRAFT_1313829 [Mycena polygramma]|nr:hypothetical protein DFH06DRAFT_1313829 [Mycena polygramma]
MSSQPTLRVSLLDIRAATACSFALIGLHPIGLWGALTTHFRLFSHILLLLYPYSPFAPSPASSFALVGLYIIGFGWTP